jgi:hypothetical protein
LEEMILRETDRLEYLRGAFPASWFGIQDQLDWYGGQLHFL